MKQHHASCEITGSGSDEIDQPLQVDGLIAHGGVARANVVDSIGANSGKRNRGWDAQLLLW